MPPATRSVTAMTRLGYQIPNFTYPGVGPGDLFEAVARQAIEAEDSGFDTVLVMDHFYHRSTRLRTGTSTAGSRS